MIIYEANHNFIFKEDFIFKEVRCVVRKVNDVSLNQRFVETDDEEEARELLRRLFRAHYQTVFDIVNRRRWKHPDTVVDPDEITSTTFLKAFNKRKQIGEPEKLVEWLVTVAKNLMIDKIRKSRQKRNLEIVRLDNLSISERSAPSATSLSETYAERAEAKQLLEAQLLLLLQDQDREIVDLLIDELRPKEIAEVINSTSEADKKKTAGAVQKKLERIGKWVIPIVHNLGALINCLPEAKDRKIMERHFNRQSLSEITKALGVSRVTVEKTVNRVIAGWKKAARDNPADPVSAMVKKER